MLRRLGTLLCVLIVALAIGSGPAWLDAGGHSAAAHSAPSVGGEPTDDRSLAEPVAARPAALAGPLRLVTPTRAVVLVVLLALAMAGAAQIVLGPRRAGLARLGPQREHRLGSRRRGPPLTA